MAHATLDVRMTGITEVVALLRAATDVVDLATREPEDQPPGTSLIGTRDLDALNRAVRAFIPEPDDATVGGSQ